MINLLEFLSLLKAFGSIIKVSSILPTSFYYKNKLKQWNGKFMFLLGNTRAKIVQKINFPSNIMKCNVCKWFIYSYLFNLR